MPLTQDPNPGRISSWAISGHVDIVWDTGSNQKGKVVLSTDDEPEIDFDGGNKSSGRKSLRVMLNHAYVLRLLDPGGVQIGLALTINVEETLPLPANLGRALKHRASLFLKPIYDIRATAGVETFRIRFKTNLPTQPSVLVRNDNTKEVVAAAITWKDSTTHSYRFGDPGSLFGPLQQKTIHRYEILIGPVPSDNVSGTFVTGTREATALFGDIKVYDDGDSGFLDGAGDFRLQLGLGGIDGPGWAQESLSDHGIESGGSWTLNKPVTVDRIAPRVWVQVLSREYDGSIVGSEDVGYAQEGVEWWGENEDSWTRVTRHVDFSDLSNGTDSTPFKLETGPVNVNFTVTGTISMTVTPGRMLGQEQQAQSATVRFFPTNAAATAAIGERIKVSDHSRQQMIFVGPDNTIHHITAANGSSRTRWRQLDMVSTAPLTVVPGVDRLHLLSVGPAAELRYASCAVDQEPRAWTVIVAESLSRVTGHVLSDGRLMVWGIDSAGHMLLTDIRNGAAGTWSRIGDGFVDHEMFVVSDSSGSFTLIALRADRHIVYQRFSPEGHRDGDWQSLGVAPDGILVAGRADADTIVMAVISPTDQVYALPWRDYPRPLAPGGWLEIGTVESLRSTSR
jgi:hypothetical protein